MKITKLRKFKNQYNLCLQYINQVKKDDIFDIFLENATTSQFYIFIFKK